MMDTPKEIDVLDYLRVIWRRAWLIALILFLTAAVTFTVSALIKKVYETETTFRIMSQQRSGSTALSQVPSSTLAVLGVSRREQELQTCSQVLRSRQVIDKVVSACPYLLDGYNTEQRGGLFGKVKNILESYDKDVREQIGEEEFRRRLLLRELRRSIKVRQLGGDVLSVRVKWDDPNAATDIANELGKAFIEYDRLARQEAADRALNFIQRALRGTGGQEDKSRVAEYEENEGSRVAECEENEGDRAGVDRKLAEAERNLRDFKKQRKMVVMQEEAKKLIEKFVDAEDALSSAIIAGKMAEARLDDIQKQLAGQSQTVVSAKTVTDNPIVQYLQREMAQMEVQAESLRVNFGAANPELRALENQIAEYEKRIRKEIPRIVSQEITSANLLYEFLRQEEINCLIDITVSKARESAVRERIAALEEKLTQMPDEEMQLTYLTREVEAYNRIYLTLRQNESEAQLSKESITASVSVLDEPDIPLEPAAPKLMLNTAIGGVIGLMLGLGVVFFLEYVKRANVGSPTTRKKKETETQGKELDS